MTSIYSNPIALRVQDGTGMGGTDLCASCRFALRRKGSLTGFGETRCGALQGNPVVPTRLQHCTAYLERGRMSLPEMNEAAWLIEVRGKSIGFLSPEELARRREHSAPPSAPIGF